MKGNLKEKGITLIALVITIIVLLILAGVSIAMLTGENGILTKATESKEETQKAQDEELKRLTALSAATNLKNTTFTDKDNKTVVVPAGFAVSEKEGENTVKDGLVIIDTEGNEFVWVPVEEDNYVRNSNYSDKEVSSQSTDDVNYLPNGITNEKETVLKYGGFYIGRYETGKENKIICQKNKSVSANISQEQAKEEAKKFVNNEYVKSALISGVQWDATMNFINGNLDGNGNVYDVTKTNDSRHTNKEEKTGQNEADKVCNIYDLEGNYWEYVAEKNTSPSSLNYNGRGGSYYNAHEASYRYDNDGGKGENTTYRLVLYLCQDAN